MNGSTRITDLQKAKLQKLEIEKLKAEIAALKPLAKTQPKTWARKASEWLFTGGAALGLITVAASYFGQIGGQETSAVIARCERALKIVSTAQLNTDMSESQRKRLADSSLRTLAECDRKTII